jgi:hypothetical protein
MDGLHINWTRYSEVLIGVHACPTCKGFAEMLDRFQEWYGWYSTCLCCGEQWQDSEMCERPFRPRWRRDNIENAQREIEKRGLRFPPFQPNCSGAING